MELPDDAKHELDELERMIQVEVQICDYIKARKAAMDENVITGVRKEADEMTKVWISLLIRHKFYFHCSNPKSLHIETGCIE
jgi:hypothetical protein